jgi:Fe-S-cluster containining protein
MPARTPVSQRFELFDHTIAQMGQRLERVRQPEQMMEALGWGMAELERTYAETKRSVLATVACRSGCDACCHVPIDVQAHEVLFAAHHIQLHFSPDALAALIDRLAVHRANIAALAPGDRDLIRQPCALLRPEDGACSIYEGRPQACRTHHSSDASVCAAYNEDSAVPIEKVYIPALRARMFAVMLGVDEALESAGYDERAYDYGSALHEALTNSLCLVNWMRRQNAFPDSCLAYPDEPKG